MKTINVYKFSELNEEAKENAINHYRNTNDNDFWGSERLESYKAAKEYYDLLHNIEGEISGKRLYAWIWNNIICNFVKTNFISKHKSGKTGNSYFAYKYNECTKYKRSNVFVTNTLEDCPLTGVCYDFDFLQPIIDFFKKPSKNITSSDLEIPSYDDVAQKDFDYQNSDEYIIEELESIDDCFTENGKLI